MDSLRKLASGKRSETPLGKQLTIIVIVIMESQM